MTFRARCGIWFVGWLALAAPAHAAFPGHNGMLAVQPLHGRGIVLVRSDGADARRICTTVAVCGHPRRPMFSPDGRAIVLAGPAMRLISTDGSCMNCQFGNGTRPAFRVGGSLVSFVSSGAVLEDGIDGLRQPGLDVGVPRVSDAVWSASGRLAVAARGRVWVGEPGRLRSIGRGSAPSWSPNGSRLAIVRAGWVTIVRASNRSARRLVRGTAPAFSPDGRWIAFIDRRRRVRVIRSRGGKVRGVGRVRGAAVDWQPLPAHPPACVAPPGSSVAARSEQAIVTTDASPGPGAGGLPDTAAMGCLFADGRERLLGRSTFNSIDTATDYPLAAVGGTYAGVVSDNYDDHYGGDSESVAVFNLHTGGQSGGASGCGVSACAWIDQLVVGAEGAWAVHVNGGPSGNRLYPGADPLRVVCASGSLCLATNQFGDVLSSTSPMQSPWRPATGARMNSGVAGSGSCPSVSLCVLVAGSSIFTSTDPAAGAWTTTQLAGSPDYFAAVDCPTTSLCVATTDRGQVATSTDPTGGASAWSLQDVDGSTPIYGISCPSTSECIATDLNGNVITSTNPTGDASAWSVRSAGMSPFGLSFVTCPSTTLCVATAFPSGVAVSSDPIAGSWTSTGQTGIADLACPLSSFCIGVGSDNTVAFSTDPASGPWSRYTVPSSTVSALNSVSCPTASFCVATGGANGYVLVSTDPAGGASTWTPVLADKVDCGIATGACGTEQIIASDRTRSRVLDQSTEFEVQTGPQLTDLTIDGDTLTWEDHGSPRSAQLTP